MSPLAIAFAPDHPAASGHFPGNPIIPGATLLAEVLQAVGQATRQDLSQARLTSAKFPSPARPGDRVEVDYSLAAARCAIVCSVAGRIVLKVEIVCGGPSHPG